MKRKAPAPAGFARFYTPELAVLLFWITVIAVVCVVIASASRPLVLFVSTLVGGLVLILFSRVILEVMAVLFQIHARLTELCGYEREVREAARKAADQARIAANKATGASSPSAS
ncbi:MAG: hypothetical protein AB7E72_12445 [Lysobacterales bacterium]